MSAATNWLRRNDPETRSVYILLWEESSDADLAQALHQNPFIEEIHICFGRGEDLNSWPLLQQVIETKENLTSVVLYCASESPSEDALVLPFLEAAHANTTIEEITLAWLKFVPESEFFNFLSTTTFDDDKILIFNNCDMADPSQREQGAKALATSSIKHLQIKDCNATFMSALLRNLGQHTTILKELRLDILEPDSPCYEVVQLLQDTKTLQRFHLQGRYGRETSAAMKQRLLCGIKKNFSLRVVTALHQDQRPLFGQETGQQRLDFYANRNVHLEEWVEKPDVLVRELWPEALSLAQQAGPDALFKSLQYVLGKDYAKVSSSGKKRKRTEL